MNYRTALTYHADLRVYSGRISNREVSLRRKSAHFYECVTCDRGERRAVTATSPQAAYLHMVLILTTPANKEAA